MDNETIQKQNIVERYVSGTLTGDELTEFELFMLDHPEIVDDIEYEQGMRDALGKVERQLQTSPAANESSFFASSRYGVAATVLLALALVFSSVQYQELSALRERSGGAVESGCSC